MNYEKINAAGWRNGRVLAPDANFTGEEPMWQDAASWDGQKFLKERQRGLHFYNYYVSPEDLKLSTLQWMVNNKYPQAQINIIQEAPSYVPTAATHAIARMINRGMPSTFKISDEETIDDGERLKNKISEALQEISSGLHISRSAKLKASTPAVESPANIQERIRLKTQATAGVELEAMLDKWIEAGDQVVKPLDFYSILQNFNIAVQAVGPLKKWLEKHLTEFTEAAEGKDEQLVEAYAHLSKRALRSRIEGLQAMLNDIITHCSAKKAGRKPRKKKGITAEKQVSRMRFLPSSKEFNVSSISTSLIPGAQVLYTFNVKYRYLACYVADSTAGLSVKGTTIKGFNPKFSFGQSLRKPEIVLPLILSKTRKQLDKELDLLTTKRREPNGRCNEDTIILRADDK